MIHFSRHLKRLPIVLALVVVGVLIVPAGASATHPTTGLEPSLSGYLVPVYRKCNPQTQTTAAYRANIRHSTPIGVGSCGTTDGSGNPPPANPTIGPALQDAGGAGAKKGVGPGANSPIWTFTLRFSKAPDPLCGNGQPAPGNSTVCLNASVDSLVQFSTANPPYDQSTATPFVGTIGLQATIRFTDHYNCMTPACTTSTGQPGTGTDFLFGPIPTSCAVGGDGKSHCTVNTDANTVLAGAVVNGIKTSIQIFRVQCQILSAPYGGSPQAQLCQQGIAWP